MRSSRDKVVYDNLETGTTTTVRDSSPSRSSSRGRKWYHVRLWSKSSKLLGGLFLALVITSLIIISVVLAYKAPNDPAVNPPDKPHALYAEHGAVATDNPICSQIGAEILSNNGHAVDAAIASALCLGVLNPFASGIGGGGVMLVYNNMSSNDVTVYDFRETAPAGATKNMYASNPLDSQTGPLAVAVPSELKGMYHVWQKYGKRTWKDIVQPAADLATKGFYIGTTLAIRLVDFSSFILADPDLTLVYTDGHGKVLKEGDKCYNAKLGTTLQTIADQGVDILYNGAMGQQIAQDIQKAGGILTFDDIKNYQVVERVPVSTYYHGYKIVTAGAPFGGLCMSMALNLVERYNLGGKGNIVGLGADSMDYDADSLHWIVEGWKFAFADRMAYGDPKYVDLDFITPTMLSKDHAALLRQRLNPDKTFPPLHYLDLVSNISQIVDSGTTHISVIDKTSGSAVSFTSTVNLAFGSRFVSPSTGILLNDEMDDFSQPNSSNAFGLPPSKANFIAPGKRPLSSMSPSLVFLDERLFMAVGSSGGPKIITSTMNAIVKVLSFGMGLYDAIQTPKFHHQLIPDELQVEPELDKNIVAGLQVKGNKINVVDSKLSGITQGVMQDSISGGLYAVSDRRKHGAPAGY